MEKMNENINSFCSLNKEWNFKPKNIT
jgi:hypothetical protein